MSRKPDNHAGLRTFLNTAIPQNRKYIANTMPGAIVAGVLSTIQDVPRLDNSTGKKPTSGTDRTQDALGHLARATADLCARLRT